MIKELKKSNQTSLKPIAVFWFNNICTINPLTLKCNQIKKNPVRLVGARNWLLWRTKLYTRAHACHCHLFTETLEALWLCRQCLHFTSTSEFLNFHFQQESCSTTTHLSAFDLTLKQTDKVMAFNFHSPDYFNKKFNKAKRDSNLTLRRLMIYIYGAPILDVSRSHTTTQHSR
jgi:hypothetical protein